MTRKKEKVVCARLPGRRLSDSVGLSSPLPTPTGTGSATRFRNFRRFPLGSGDHGLEQNSAHDLGPI
ncbi:hypothetical protein NL676_006754 [Syzygium grande]|nr:hypothetical protein NL676_006754 [Syzygium grande]